MNAAITTITLLLAAMASILAARHGSAIRISPTAFVLAPILFLAGARLRKLLTAGFIGSTAAASSSQVILGTLILGGSAAVLGASARPLAEAGPGTLLLLGLALSLGEPWLASRLDRAPSGSARGAARLGALLEAQGIFGLLIALVLAVILRAQIAPAGGPPAQSLEFLRPCADILKGLGAGAATGLLGCLVLGPVRSEPTRMVLSIALAEAGTISALMFSGAELFAPFIAGSIAWREAGGASDRNLGAPEFPAGEDRRALVPKGPSGASFPHGDLLILLCGAGLFAGAGMGLEFVDLTAAMGLALLFCGGSMLLRFLVQLGVGGLCRWFHPWEIPQRWLLILAWSSPPGPLALGLFLVVCPSAPAGTQAVLLLSVLTALAIQGLTAPLALRAVREDGPANTGMAERWEILSARAIALRAESEAAQELIRRGDLDEEAAAAIQGALGEAEHRLAMDRDGVLGAEPGLRAGQTARAVRAILAAGREAVARARLRGQVDGAAASRVEREIARGSLRTASAPLHDVIAGANGPWDPEGTRESAPAPPNV